MSSIYSPLSQKTITRKGLAVTEIICQEGDGRKLVWCRDDASKMTVDGRTNPLFHANYDGSERGEQEAREKVAASFDSYWPMAS